MVRPAQYFEKTFIAIFRKLILFYWSYMFVTAKTRGVDDERETTYAEPKQLLNNSSRKEDPRPPESVKTVISG